MHRVWSKKTTHSLHGALATPSNSCTLCSSYSQLLFTCRGPVLSPQHPLGSVGNSPLLALTDASSTSRRLVFLTGYSSQLPAFEITEGMQLPGSVFLRPQFLGESPPKNSLNALLHYAPEPKLTMPQYSKHSGDVSCPLQTTPASISDTFHDASHIWGQRM